MSLIDREALIEMLATAIRIMKDMAKFLGAEDDPEIKMEIKAYTDILEGVKEQPTIEPEPKWIPVSERLPEDKTAYYLVTLGNFGDFYVYHEEIDIARWDCDHRKGKDSWHWCKERTVTAWMPLPEPYERRQE